MRFGRRPVAIADPHGYARDERKRQETEHRADNHGRGLRARCCGLTHAASSPVRRPLGCPKNSIDRKLALLSQPAWQASLPVP